MRINKTILEGAKQFTRLKSRWSRLPERFILDVMNNSTVDEKVLNKIRSKQLTERIREYARKKNTNG